MTPPTTSSARSLLLLLRYLDARFLHRWYCESCGKPTVRDHRRTASLEHILLTDWRDS